MALPRGDIRDQCIDVAIEDASGMPEMTRLALAGYAQADDVEATATLALNIAAMGPTDFDVLGGALPSGVG